MKSTALLFVLALFVFLAVPVFSPEAQAQTCRLNANWPAFDYDGKPALADGSYLKTTVASSQVDTPRHAAESRTMTTPDGRLHVRLDCKSYKGFPAEDYAVLLTNLSKTEPTGIIADFRSLKLSVDKPGSNQTIALRALRGSTCQATDFIPEAFLIEVGKEKALTTTCGRSSNDFVPFLELNLDDRNGYLFVVGWTGSWKARFANAGRAVEIEIGMERTHFRLLPGETIRQPSVLVLVQKNQTRREFKTLVHRFMLENKVPRDSKGHVIPPILAVASGGGNKTPKMMADVLQYCVDNRMPFDTYWIELVLDNLSAPNYTAEGGPKHDGTIRGVNDVKPIDTPDHFLDWLRCLRSGKPTRAPIEAGYLHSVVGLMAVESFRNGYRTTYDPQTRTISKA
jgi:hypothetical protein